MHSLEGWSCLCELAVMATQIGREEDELHKNHLLNIYVQCLVKLTILYRDKCKLDEIMYCQFPEAYEYYKAINKKIINYMKGEI